MRRISKESYNWAAGSYVDLFIVSAVTQVLFVIGLYWTFLGDTDWVGGPLKVGSNVPILAIGTLPVLGWGMALAIGIGFDKFPLDYKAAPFDPSLISTIAALNIGGQILIIAGILASNHENLESLAKMGATLLAAQLILIGPLAWRLSKARSAKDNVKVGIWGIGSMLSLPVIGVVTILSWIFVHNDWFYILFWTVILDGFWLMVTFTLILAHFQDRLGWQLMDQIVTGRAFAVFSVLVIIHILLSLFHQSGVITNGIVGASISAPILWIFFVSRPDRIWKNVFAGKKCSAQILSAHSWLLATAVIGIYEGIYFVGESGMFYTRFMLIFGVVIQTVWGSSVYLHEDHNHIEIEDRKTRWISVIMMLTLMTGIIYLALNAGGHLSKINPEIVVAITILALLIAALEFFIWLVRDGIFNHDGWHRMPMYYSNMDNYDLSDDEYFSSESE
ncbi:MAG TPA: hypothetical protein EYN58_03975 [Candidatus Poseidoniales archaeon]|nr:hypothetical protein [Candidatus Poseidoniales archaeon]HIO57536.1 hypothetical protein [Candidatus Poseidoniales archaeon]